RSVCDSLARNLSYGVLRDAVWLYLGLHSGDYPAGDTSEWNSAESCDLSRSQSDCECAAFAAVYYPANCSHSTDQVNRWYIDWYMGSNCSIEDRKSTRLNS